VGRSPERSFELNGLAPSKGVRGVGGSEYLAEGADPQMLWRPSSEMRPLLTGRSAVRVRVRMEALDGRLTSPCIYVDWGDGFSEESRKPLTLVEPGLYSGVAHTNAGACRRIRFDPSSTPCRFALTAFEVEPTAAPSAHVPRLGVGRRLLRRVVRRLPVGVQNALQRARRGPGQGRKPGLTGILRAIRPGSGDPWRAT
jgi:hypothetical protein